MCGRGQAGHIFSCDYLLLTGGARNMVAGVRLLAGGSAHQIDLLPLDNFDMTVVFPSIIHLNRTHRFKLNILPGLGSDFQTDLLISESRQSGIYLPQQGNCCGRLGMRSFTLPNMRPHRNPCSDKSITMCRFPKLVLCVHVNAGQKAQLQTSSLSCQKCQSVDVSHLSI